MCSILGYDVKFPQGKNPFPPQRAVMAKVLKALKEEKNALLESPTGTGKTLSFLTSTLAWQKTFIDARNEAIDARNEAIVIAARNEASTGDDEKEKEEDLYMIKKDAMDMDKKDSKDHSQSAFWTCLRLLRMTRVLRISLGVY